MVSPLKVFINGLGKDTQPIKVIIKKTIAPIKVVIADIDMMFVVLNKTILFKHFSKCKTAFITFFARFKNVIKSTFYIKPKNVFVKFFGKINTNTFKTKIISSGDIRFFGKLNNKLKSKIKINNAFSVFYLRFNNKFKSKINILNNKILLIFNYRFRKWTTDNILFQNTIYEDISTKKELSFGETCYEEIEGGDV